MSLLCGTDFSPYATEAATAAAFLAQKYKEILRLVHVQPTKDTASEEKKTLLQKEAERLRQLGAAVKEEILRSDAPEECLAEEARVGGHLLIIGAPGHQAVFRWSLGDTATRLLRLSRVPVLVVRASQPFEVWTREGKSLRLLVGADASEPALAALRWVEGLCKQGSCEVIAARVYDPILEHPRLGIPGVQSYVQGHPEIDKALLRELSARVGEVLDAESVSLQVRAHQGEPAACLMQMAAENAADVLVVGTHQRKGLQKLWLGSTSEELIRFAPVAVVCVPTRAEAEEKPSALPQIRRVLVPTDFSAVGNSAIPHAYSAAGAKGIVRLLHVVEGPTDATEIKNKEQLIERLRALIPAEAEALQIETETEIVSSPDTGEAIYQAAERMGADLICLGSHGRSGISKWIGGSIAQEVMERSRRPLLVIQAPTVT